MMLGRGGMHKLCGRACEIGWLVMGLAVLGGCGHAIPIAAKFEGDVGANVMANATFKGDFAVKLPTAADPGEIISTVVRAGQSPASGARIAMVDVDGLLLNQNYGSLYAVGDNPLAGFRDKLEAAARDPQVVAVLLRVNSPGGSVTACDIMAEELKQFRAEAHKPVVACLMDVATAGAYYVASGSDRVVAHPTALTGGLGVVFNHFNLQDAMAQLNVVSDPVKSGENIDMGTVTNLLDDKMRALLQKMADGYREHLVRNIKLRRTSMTAQDQQALGDGRIVVASEGLALHLVDRLGYLHDAIAEAEQLSGVSNAEVVLLHRSGYPAHSLYAITPAPAPLSDSLPFSYPGLDRSKLPSFLYLWQPDPTLPRPSTH